MEALAQRLARIEKALTMVLPDAVSPLWLSRVAGVDCPEASPEWADAFLEPGRDLLRRGGKRWRPLVTVLTCESLGAGSSADILSALTEIPHTGSLIVDDIEDSSLTRRGAPAIHLVYGEDLAINMGNLMYFLPTIVFSQTNFDEVTLASMERDWLAVMRRLHLGQGYDILWHSRADLYPDEASYMRMCRFKTGSLASLAARLGSRAAGASPHLIKELDQTWEKLGTGFQILDDVQNLSSGIPGKDRGDDIVEGKKSLPVILHAASHPSDLEQLTKLFAEAAKKAPKGDWTPVEEAIALLTKSGVIHRARETGRSLLDSGRSSLEYLLPDNEGRRLLIGLVDAFHKKMI